MNNTHRTFGPKLRTIFKLAQSRSEDLSEKIVGSHQLFLALLQEAEQDETELLDGFSVNLQRIQQAINARSVEYPKEEDRNLFQSVTSEDSQRTEVFQAPSNDNRVSLGYYCKRSLEQGISAQLKEYPESVAQGIDPIYVLIALLGFQESYLGLLLKELNVDVPALQNALRKHASQHNEAR